MIETTLAFQTHLDKKLKERTEAMEGNSNVIISMTMSEFNAKIEEMVQAAVQAALKNLKLGEARGEDKKLATDIVETTTEVTTVTEDEPIAKEAAAKDAEWAEMRKFFQDQKRKDKRIACSDLSWMPKVNLPEDFKMPKLIKFDGMGDPVVHLKQYVGILKMAKLDEKAITHLFPYALEGAAVRWYYTLKDEEIEKWSKLSQKFLEQYSYNSEVDLTRSDLKETHQEEGETFTAFIKRWREKASKVINRPSDHEQNKMILDNLTDKYYQYMFNHSTKVSCAEFCERGFQCDDAFKKGRLEESDYDSDG